MARPSKLTPARQRAICAAIERGATYGHAAEAAGISRETLADWRKHNDAFSDAITRAAAKSELALLEVLHAAAPDDWRAAGFILERRWPDDWGKRSRVDANVSGSLDSPDVRTVVRQVGAVLGIVLGDDPDRCVWASALLQAVDDGWDPTADPTPPIARPDPDAGPFPWQPTPVLPVLPRQTDAATRVHRPSQSRGAVDEDFIKRHTGGGTGGGVR